MAEIAYNLSAFCENYKLDTKACAAELLSFSNFYHRTPNADEENSSMSDIGVFLSNTDNYMVDCYPCLFRAYTIAMAIPISSCTAERAFSVVKRVKSNLRTSMLQERMEELLLLAIEREKVDKIDKTLVIQNYGLSSKALSRPLIL